ncbi:MAG: class I SAM-dependent methyltransferase [Oscillospiraceae bacterium]|nr:class I SAM-dependent methyltransferase [Oscillospiraceae bacterium]
MDKNTNWPEFIKRTLDTPPRWMMKKTLELFGDFAGHAVDLGCGSGIDTIELAERGWTVYAVDSTPDGFANIMSKLPEDKQAKVKCIQADFEHMAIPEADLIYSVFSLPFCKPEHFGAFWEKIVSAIKPGGRFAGNLFGVKDEWAYMSDATFITKEQFDELFKDFTIEHFREQYSEGPSVLVPTKLWHLFDVVAQKR